MCHAYFSRRVQYKNNISNHNSHFNIDKLMRPNNEYFIRSISYDKLKNSIFFPVFMYIII